MTILLPALGVAFAAFCVWLTVRIINRRGRWAKWTLAGVAGLPMIYVLSFGPACWWFSPSPLDPVTDGDALLQEVVSLRGTTGRRAPGIYWPLGWMAGHGPAPLSRAIRSYATLSGDSIDLPLDRFGSYFIVKWPH
jgi:hypothetical protein